MVSGSRAQIKQYALLPPLLLHFSAFPTLYFLGKFVYLCNLGVLAYSINHIIRF
jgi:hypothetical protein